MVKIDPAQVQQVLFNLVLNARDAMSGGGPIHVRTGNRNREAGEQSPKQSTSGVFLSVKDSGCGMTADTRAHLFEPFFTTKAKGRGTGLGLSTVHNIVTGNGGSVEVDSEPERGTKVTVLLPRLSEPSVEKISRFTVHSPGETILLLEDNTTIRQAAQRILSESGYAVLEAASGPEAIAVAREHRVNIDLLLADVDVPGMNGREAALEICSERPQLKVLYMSGFERPARQAGQATVLFKKPFTSSELLEKLREILDGNSSPKKSEKRKREKP
jgi:CheY-like chemotaxis protein